MYFVPREYRMAFLFTLNSQLVARESRRRTTKAFRSAYIVYCVIILSHPHENLGLGRAIIARVGGVFPFFIVQGATERFYQ